MGKGAKGKSSATAATRKKHAKKHAQPDDAPNNQPQVKRIKKDRGKKKDKEPRKKVYIPPVKPAPVQPDPLETTGLAHTLPPELLVVLRSFNKKAQVTKIRALEELNTGWVEKALAEGEEGMISYTLVDMLPVWMHHVPALLIHPSRRVRFLAASIHLSFLRIPPVRDQVFFFLRESASESHLEQIVGTWSMSAHDVDKTVATTSTKSWKDAYGQLKCDDALFEFIQQTVLDPEGIYTSLHPVQPTVPQQQSQPQSRKGSGKNTPVRRERKDDPESTRSKVDEAEESDQDKKARLRIGALGALGWLIQNSARLPETAIVLFANHAFLTCLHPSPTPPWIEMEAFGYAQPPVRKAMWSLVHVLLQKQKDHLKECIPGLSRAMLRSAWVESDLSVQSVLWHPLLTFLKDFPSAWESASIQDAEDREDEEPEDEEEDSEDEDEDQPSRPKETPPTGPSFAAYEEFLEFLRKGCGGSPIQGYPVVVLIMSTIPASMLFANSYAGLDKFFAAFWEALDSRALSSLNRVNASAAFLSSVLESTGFLIRRLFAAQESLGLSEGEAHNKANGLVEEQVKKVWSDLEEGRLKVDETVLAKEFSKTLGYLRKVKPELHSTAWNTIKNATAAVSKTHPGLVATFLKGLSEDGQGQGQSPTAPLVGGAKEELLTELAGDALAAYEDPSEGNEGAEKAKQLLPDLLNRFQGDLFKDAPFVQRLETLLEHKTGTLLDRSPSLIVSILSYWKDEQKANAVWQRVLRHLASPDPSIKASEDEKKRMGVLTMLLDVIRKSRLPAHLKPVDEVFDGVVSAMFARVVEKPGEQGVLGCLRGVLQFHSYFMTSKGFLELFSSISSSLKYQIAQIFDGTDSIPFTGMNALLDLVFSSYTSSPKTVSAFDGVDELITQVILYGRLLPLCEGVDEKDSEDTFTLALDLWHVWSRSVGGEQKDKVSVAVKKKVREFVVGTNNPRVSPLAVLSMISQRIPDLTTNGSLMDFLPTEKELEEMLEGLSSTPIDPSMAVVDPLLPPHTAGRRSSSQVISKDQNGFSSYARGVFAVLQVLSVNRVLAKKNLWALKHFVVLGLCVHDLQSVPARFGEGGGHGPFDERALGVSGPMAVSEITKKVDQMTTYLLLSGGAVADGGRDWRSEAVDRLTSGKGEEGAIDDVTLSGFLVRCVNEAVEKEKVGEGILEARVLRVVLDHVLEELESADAGKWVVYARKIERSAPETSLSIIYSVAQARLETQKLDRYRNEVAASLLGIPPAKVNTEGLLALRKLAASAPDPDSDVVFLPQLRAVNVVKACQKWVEEGGDDEDDDDDEGGVDEEVENAMLPVFCALAPILQNDHGKHWEFVFDLVETVLENSSVEDDDTLVGLSRALKMLLVIEDLCMTNKGLRAEWEPRRTNVLTLVRDLAGVRLENTAVSLPRSICRELLLSIVQTLPASLIDRDTLAKMCHLITDPSTDVQKMAYAMLKTAAEKRTEYLVIEVGVGNLSLEEGEAGKVEEEEATTKAEVEESIAEQAPVPQPQPQREQKKAKGGKGGKGRKKKQKEKISEKDSAPGLLPSELVRILQQDVALLVEEDDFLAEQRAFGWMLAWMLVFDSFKDASFKVKSMYIEQLRNFDLVGSKLLPNIIAALRLDGGLSKAFKIGLWGVDEFYVQYFEPSNVISIPVLAAHLYYRSLLCVPSLVHTWVLDCKDRQLSNAITTITAQYFSPLIIQAELAHVRSPEGIAELTGDGLTVKVVGGSGGAGGAVGSGGASGNEVVAAYSVDEHQLELRLKIPSDWPLHKIEVKDEKRVGVDENRWRAWVLAVQQTIWMHNGRIVDGLSLFKKNVTLHFEGQVECAICYSIISVMDGSLPKKPCKTCKNRFHAGCLYKWFNTSHSSSCPLCRTNII